MAFGVGKKVFADLALARVASDRTLRAKRNAFGHVLNYFKVLERALRGCQAREYNLQPGLHCPARTTFNVPEVYTFLALQRVTYLKHAKTKYTLHDSKT